MNEQTIMQLINQFDQSSAVSLELEMEECHLKLKKAQAYGKRKEESEIAYETENTEANHALEKGSKAQQSDFAEKAENIVRSPIVGTFYASPAEDKAPFVTEGSRVKKGEVIGLLEAMKMISEVNAPKDGVVKKCLVENATLVDYDKPLFVIE